MSTTVLLVIVGAWLILRTVRQDSEGKTLVDRVLGK